MNDYLHDKRDFVDMISLRILRWGNYCTFFRWALNVIAHVLMIEGEERQRLSFNYRREVVDVMMEERGCSDLKKGHEPRKIEDFQKLEKARKQILPKSL